jgi:hypothetical protein
MTDAYRRAAQLSPTYSERSEIDTTTPETLPMLEYEVQEARRSRYDRDRTITVVVAMLCPRCKTQRPIIFHGNPAVACKHCGLSMQLFGNGLIVSGKDTRIS